MSQGSNFKKEVMEALFNAPTNLITNKAIMWAASNLPDEGGNGRFETTLRSNYQHKSDSLWTAIGMPGELETVFEKFRDAFMEFAKSKNESGFAKSEMFEHLEKTLGAEGMMFMTVHGFMEIYTNIIKINEMTSKKLDDVSEIPDELPDGLKDILKKLIELKKKLGGDK